MPWWKLPCAGDAVEGVPLKAAILLTFWVVAGISLGGFLFAASRLFPRPVELSESAAYRWGLLMLSAAVVGLTYVLCVLASR